MSTALDPVEEATVIAVTKFLVDLGESGERDEIKGDLWSVRVGRGDLPDDLPDLVRRGDFPSDDLTELDEQESLKHPFRLASVGSWVAPNLNNLRNASGVVDECFRRQTSVERAHTVAHILGWASACPVESKLFSSVAVTSKYLNPSHLLKSLVVRTILDHDMLLDNYGPDGRFVPLPATFGWTDLDKLIPAKEYKERISSAATSRTNIPKLSEMRRDTISFCIDQMLYYIGLGSLRSGRNFSTRKDFASLLGGYAASRSDLNRFVKKLDGLGNRDFLSSDDPFPKTAILCARLKIAIEEGVGKRIKEYSGDPKKRNKAKNGLSNFLQGDESLWRHTSKNDCDKSREELKGHADIPIQEIIKAPPTPRGCNGSPNESKASPMFRKHCSAAGIGKTGLESTDPAVVSSNQPKLFHYSNHTNNSAFDTHLKKVFSGRISRVLKERDFGKEAVVNAIRLPLDPEYMGLDGNNASKDECETMAWSINNAFSGDFVDEILEYVNEAPFLGSSSNVGAKGGKTSRFYRCSQGTDQNGGYFHLSNDDSLIKCDDMEEMEVKLASFVSELMEAQDRIVGEQLPDGLYQCEWVNEKVMCQATAASITGSAYAHHSDKGFHHSHDIYNIDGSSEPLEKELFMALPHTKLMRVVTIVVSNREGVNSELAFKPSQGGSIDGTFRELKERLKINHCTVHIQSYGLQGHYTHRVYSNEQSGPTPYQGEEVGARVVLSFRISLCGEEDNLAAYALQKSTKLSVSALEDARGDYNQYGILDSIRFSEKPTSGRKSSTQSSPKRRRTKGIVEEQSKAASRIHQFLLDNKLDLTLCEPEKSGVNQNREDPPYETSYGWVEDTKPMWERILSSTFVTALADSGISFYTKLPKELDKSGSEVEMSSGNFQYSRFGSPPVMDVLSNRSMEARESVKRTLIPGDIVSAETVRSMFDLPQNTHKSQLWRYKDSALLNCVVLRHMYKNDAEGIRTLQGILDSPERWEGPGFGDLVSPSIWIGGSGGSAQEIGAKPMNLKSAKKDRPPPLASLHTDMEISNRMNRAMMDAASRGQPVFLFCSPLDCADENDKKEKEEQTQLQYLGLFKVDGYSYDADDKATVLAAAEREARINGTSVECEFWNHTYRLSRHFKFRLKMLNMATDNQVQGAPVQAKKFVLDMEGSHYIKQKLFHTINLEQSMFKQLLEDSPPEEGSRLLPVFMNRYLPELLKGAADPTNKHDESEDNETGEDDYQDPPYRQLDDDYFSPVDHSGQQKNSEGGEEIGVQGEGGAEKPPEPDKGSTHGGPVENNGIEVSVNQMLSMVSRLNVGGALRFKRRHYNSESDSYGYLPNEPIKPTEELPRTTEASPQAPMIGSVGPVIRACPFPMGTRTMDLCTSFFLECVIAGHDEFRVDKHSKKEGVQAGTYVAMQKRTSLSMDVLRDLLCTSLIFRLTGRVEQIRKYLQLVQDGGGGEEGSWKRTMNMKDMQDLSSFILACQKNVDSRRRWGSTRINVMNRWISHQFRASVPNAAKKSADSFASMMEKMVAIISEDSFIQKLLEPNLTRKDAVFIVMRLLLSSSQIEECNRSLRFVAGQVIADLEEVLSGDFLSNGRRDAPFDGDFHIIGYGGTEGMSVLGKSIGLPLSPPSGARCSQKAWETYQNNITILCNQVLETMRSMESSVLLTYGLYKGCREGSDETCIYIIQNNREVGYVDVEHNCCKLYLLLHRYRGTRAYSTPTPWRPQDHPGIFADIFGEEMNYLMDLMLSGYCEAVLSNLIEDIRQPFTFSQY